MRKHPENLEMNKQIETTSQVIDFHKTTTEQMKFFLTWTQNVQKMSEDNRKSLSIYLIQNKEKNPTEYHITLNEQGQLVASDGKNGLLLEGRVWEVPNSTLEILNNPLITKK